jgi:hypothetical protein
VTEHHDGSPFSCFEIRGQEQVALHFGSFTEKANCALIH